MPARDHLRKGSSEGSDEAHESHPPQGPGVTAANAAAARRLLTQDALHEAADKIDRALHAGDAATAASELTETYYLLGGWDSRLFDARRVSRLIALIEGRGTEALSDQGLVSVGMLAGYGGGVAAFRALAARALDGASFPFLTRLSSVWGPAAWAGLGASAETAAAARRVFERHHALVASEPQVLRAAVDGKVLSLEAARAMYRARWMPNGRLDLVARDPMRFDDARMASLLTEEDVRRIGTEVYGLQIGPPRSLSGRADRALASAREWLGMGEAPGVVEERLAGATTVAAAMVPKGHLAALQHTDVTVTSQEVVGAMGLGLYDQARDTIAATSGALPQNVLHELGHALDARMGHPSGDPALFGWRTLQSATELAAAVGLEAVDARVAGVFRAGFERLFAGERDWGKVIREESVRHGVDIAPWRRHPAYLAGAAADTTRVGVAQEALDAPGTSRAIAFFHGYYGMAYSIDRSYSQAYVAAFGPDNRVRYAPYECFAIIYEYWFGSSSHTRASALPAPARAYFENQVMSFKGLGQTPKG